MFRVNNKDRAISAAVVLMSSLVILSKHSDIYQEVEIERLKRTAPSIFNLRKATCYPKIINDVFALIGNDHNRNIFLTSKRKPKRKPSIYVKIGVQSS